MRLLVTADQFAQGYVMYRDGIITELPFVVIAQHGNVYEVSYQIDRDSLIDACARIAEW